MQLRRIPQDINVEMLLDYFGEGNCMVTFKGHHKRNAYNDIVSVEEGINGIQYMSIARDSLYHILPEYMFHPIDRYSNLLSSEKTEIFSDEYEKQEQEKERASKFFAPIDLQLLVKKTEACRDIRNMTEGNKVLLDILGNRLSEKQQNNRFIKRAMPYLLCCKMIRGNKTLLTFLLRKIFIEEGITINVKEKKTECLDIAPQYADGLDAELNDSFVGNVYDEMITTYCIHYWSYDECNEDFLKFVFEIQEFKHFVEDYFVSVEEKLHFDITHDKSTLRLSDDIDYNYLNYNTNL